MNLEKIKSLSKLSVSQLINVVLGFIRGKVNAVLLGPSGVGIVSQMNTLQNSIVGYLDLGMSNGIIKYSSTAISQKDLEFLKKILATFQVLFLILSSLMMIVGFLLLKNLTIWFFNDLSYWYAVIFVIIAIPFTLLKNGNRASVNGLGALTSIAIMDVISVINGFIIIVSLVLLFHLKGAIMSIPIIAFTDCLISMIFLRKNIKPYKIKYNYLKDFDFAVIKKLFKFAAVGLTVGTIANLVNMVIAAYMVNQLGISKIGIYNPVLAISGLYMAIVINTAMTYMFPKISSLEGKNE